MGWRTRVDADRAFNIVAKIARSRSTTFNKVAAQLEAILSDKVETPYDDVFNLLMEEMLEPEDPQALLEEMAARQPQKKIELITGRVVNADSRVNELIGHRKQKKKNADTLVEALTINKED